MTSENSTIAPEVRALSSGDPSAKSPSLEHNDVEGLAVTADRFRSVVRSRLCFALSDNGGPKQ